MAAAHHRLGNLVAIIDRNRMQIDGCTEEVLTVESLAEKYRAFGWHVLELDGHDMEAVLAALRQAAEYSSGPVVLLAETTKGCGVSYTAGVCGYHGMPPRDGLCGPESLETALCDLGAQEVIGPERLARLRRAVEKYQQAVDTFLAARAPRVSGAYWWNSGQTMRVQMDAIRNGFGRAIADLGAEAGTVALGSDITESIRMDRFYRPDGATTDPERCRRFLSLGIAEANATSVAAGLAKEGLTPFIGSYGVFITGRNWDQLRTTVAYNELNVKIVDAHGGVSVGPDGATHQALEEISLITALPHFTMVVPCDAREAEKATRAVAALQGPAVVRYAREPTPMVTTAATPFVLGQANVIRFRGESDDFLEAYQTVLARDYQDEQEDLAFLACGPMVPEAMRAAYLLKREHHLEVRIVNLHTVAPLDTAAIEAAGREVGVIVTAEEHQIGGLGNLVAAALAEADLGRPLRLRRLGIPHTFGESGQPWELIRLFGLSAEHLAEAALELLG